MKGFKDSNNKFHPITQSKGVRKSRDQSAKTQGVRMKRKGQLFKPQESRNVLVNKDNVIIWDDKGIEVAIWVRDEWEEDPSAIPAIRNAIKLANQGKVEEIKTAIDFDRFHPVQEKTRPKHLDRKARDPNRDPIEEKVILEMEMNVHSARKEDLREEGRDIDREVERRKEKLVNEVIAQVKDDIKIGDVEAIDTFLKNMLDENFGISRQENYNNLWGFLSDDRQNKLNRKNEFP